MPHVITLQPNAIADAVEQWAGTVEDIVHEINEAAFMERMAELQSRLDALVATSDPVGFGGGAA